MDELFSFLAKARQLVIQDDTEELVGEHWIYRAWSRVLDAEVWFVCCEREVRRLAEQRVPRGAIYTRTELEELVQLPYPNSRALKNMQMVKSYFNATLDAVGT